MVYPKVGTKWVCNQGGGLEMTVISELSEDNLNEDGHKKRTGDIIYLYSHNDKVGDMTTYCEERWNKEWALKQDDD